MNKDLILSENMVELGEKLKVACPENDCIVYRNIYGMYNEIFSDLKSLELHDRTREILEREARKYTRKLQEMWRENYAIQLAKKDFNL